MTSVIATTPAERTSASSVSLRIGPTMIAGIVVTAMSQASLRLGSSRNERSRIVAKPGRDEGEPVAPEVDEQRDERAQVEHHAERQRGDERVRPAEQVRDE